MSRPVRVALSLLSGVLLLIGPFLPWVSWNNLLGKAGGEWSVTPGHDKDARIVLSGFRATGTFAVHIGMAVNGRVTKDITVESPQPRAALGCIPLACGLLVCAAAIGQSKPLDFVRAALVALCGLYPIGWLLPFVVKASKLSPDIVVNPSLGVGTYLMLLSAVLALVIAVAGWREPDHAPPRRPMTRAPFDEYVQAGGES